MFRRAQNHSARFLVVCAATLVFLTPTLSHAATTDVFIQQLERLLVQLLSQALSTNTGGGITPSPSSSASVPQSSAIDSINGIPFGGPIVFGPIKCTTPPGATYVIVGPPVSKPLLCQRGICKTYDAQPPYRPGQYLLGTSLPTPIRCFEGLTPIPQPPGYPIDSFPGVGAGGPGGDGTKSGDEEQASCGSCTGDLSTLQGKSAMEACMRNQLAKLGIGVNKAACLLNVSFRSTEGGCTDVSGLQCSSLSALERLSQLCGPGSVFVTGGSESGHKTHGGGNAVDLRRNATLDQCIKDNFTYDPIRGRYVDPVTGGTFLLEGVGGRTGSTGDHWHFCTTGVGC